MTVRGVRAFILVLSLSYAISTRHAVRWFAFDPHIQSVNAARTPTEQATGQDVFPARGATVCFGGLSAPSAADLDGHVPGTCRWQAGFVLDQHA